MQFIIKLLLVALLLIGINHALAITTNPAQQQCGIRYNFSNTTIVFINGIHNDKKQACASSDRLIATLKLEGLNIGNYNFDYIHNPTKWNALDIAELTVQSRISAQAAQNIKPLGYELLANPNKYYSELGRLYKQKIFLNENKFHPIWGTTRKVLDTITTLALSQKVIIVAHSQGNFFAEAVYGILVNDASEGDPFAISVLQNIRIVGAGVVAQTSPHRKWISSTEDIALYNMISLGRLYNFTYNILDRNRTPCIGFDCGKNIIWTSIDIFAHGFNEIYTNAGVVAQEGGLRFSQIVYRMVLSSINELSVLPKKQYTATITPKTPTPSPVTGYFDKTMIRALALLGIKDATAQSTLFWYVNQTYTIKITGSGFDGKEDVEVVGSMCDSSSIQQGNGYFTKDCTGGNVAGDGNRIRTYDTTYGIEIEAPVAYQTMSLRGPILAPNAPSLADLGSGSVRVTWGAVAGVTSYEVYRGATLVRTVASDTLTITDTGLTAGISACYTIRAIANGAASQSSSNACITPAAPAVKCSGQWTTGQYNLGQTEQQTQACAAGYTGSKVLTHTCQAGTAGSAVGAWSAASTQDNCVVIAPVTCLGSWSSTRYNVGQIEEQFANTCPAGSQGQVRTFHTCQTGGSWSANAQSDNCVAVLVAPTGLSASSVSAAQNGVAGIRLVWTAVSGATRYYITRNGSANYSSQVGTNWTDPNVAAGVQYCYTINAFSSVNNSRSAESSQVCTAYQPTQVSVSPPTNVAAAQYIFNGRKAIRLTWNAASPVPDSYLVFRRDRSGMLAPIGGADTSFVDWPELNLTSGISYCYFLRADKGGITSLESNEACSIAP